METSAQFEVIRKEEQVMQDAKKGWKTVNQDFGGSSFSRSPGSAAMQQTQRKVDQKQYAADVTVKRWLTLNSQNLN